MKRAYLLFVFIWLLCGQMKGSAPGFVVGGVTFHVLSQSERTVEVIRNDTLPYKGQLTIPGTVAHDGTTYTAKAIGDGAFLYCDQLLAVTLPSSMTHIGDRAFYGCEKLAQVEIGNGIDSIGHYAFTGCKALIEISFPSSLVYIGRAAFKGCSNLRQIHAESTLPPMLSGSGILDSFAGINHSAIVVTVPNGCADLYHTTKGWSLFAHITDHSLSTGEVLLSIAVKGDGCIIYKNEEMKDGHTCTLLSGETAEMVIKAADDYTLQHVYLNDEDYVGMMHGDTLTCQEVTENTLVKVVFTQRDAYLTLCHGENGSMQIDVEENRPATIYIQPNPGWDVYKVMVDGEDVTDRLDNNKLTIEKVHRNMDVRAILVNKNQIKGDVNNDNFVNMSDVTEIINIILGKQ